MSGFFSSSGFIGGSTPWLGEALRFFFSQASISVSVICVPIA